MDFVVWLIYGFALYGLFDAFQGISKLVKNKIKNNKERSKRLYVRESKELSEDC